jgi:hypothetical protein
MSKPATSAIAAVSIAVVALLIFLVLNKDQRSIPVRPRVTEATESEPGPSAQPAPRTTAVAPALPAPVAPNADKLNEQSPLSLKLAREAIERFPDSPNAPEFEWNVVKALFNMRQLEDAEHEARIMVAKYPENHFTGDVVHHLLNHPPNPSDVPP